MEPDKNMYVSTDFGGKCRSILDVKGGKKEV